MSGLKASFLWIALLFGALCLPLVVSDRSSNYAADEATYYLPAIRQMRAHWPALDLRRDCLSATAPGYQYLLATLSLATGASTLPLRLATFAVSLALLGLLWRCFPPEHRPLATAALLTLAASNFYVKSASWIVTDNAALLAMTAALVTLLLPAAADAAVARAGALAATATFIRQIHVWLAAPVAWQAWRAMSAGSARSRWWWLAAAPLAPLAVLALLVRAWGGVVPPGWETVHYPHGVNFAAPLVYELAVLGLLGAFFYAAVAGPDWRAELGDRRAAAAAGLGLLLALAGATTPSVSAGRWGGYLWMLAAILPAPAARSMVFLLLTPLGAWLAVTLHRRLRTAAGPAVAGLWAASGALWAGSNLANRQVFHRYYEPATLIFLILWLAMLLRTRPNDRRARWAPLAVLAGGQLALTIVVVHYQVFVGPFTP